MDFSSISGAGLAALAAAGAGIRKSRDAATADAPQVAEAAANKRLTHVRDRLGLVVPGQDSGPIGIGDPSGSTRRSSRRPAPRKVKCPCRAPAGMRYRNTVSGSACAMSARSRWACSCSSYCRRRCPTSRITPRPLSHSSAAPPPQAAMMGVSPSSGISDQAIRPP